ncbi:MAG: efflux RND transporter periplasmic adaptor subunit [Marinifilaceae bacterium]|jgi:HlyD family secretion protein|nr:HlyD family efflux transporter periplasmic adaptor subunit [Marinilabiliaceae bacterium JC040]MCT4600530.1 efflux RND transporter periplasmic adaptor subunit [Marinifilaceae bacterium]
MKNKNVLVAALLVVFAAIIVYSIIVIARPNVVELQGVCEAKQIRVASKLLGRIENLNISKGDNVRAGQLLFTMNSPEVDAKKQQAEAAKQAATALKNKAYNGARREDINAAYNVYLKAKAAAEFTTKTYNRILKLYKEGVVSEQKKDEIETKMVASIKTESAAKSVWEKAKRGARQEDKAAAEALVEKANAVIKEVNIYENEINIFSPMDGEVANIISEVGELIPNGYPVVTIVDLKDVWFSFNIKETYLPKFKKGTIFNVYVPGIDKKIEVKVTYINALADFATWKATKSTGEFDIKTFEIQVRPTNKVEGLRPGMSAIYEF